MRVTHGGESAVPAQVRGKQGVFLKPQEKGTFLKLCLTIELFSFFYLLIFFCICGEFCSETVEAQIFSGATNYPLLFFIPQNIVHINFILTCTCIAYFL